jgi:hypothetical protein
MPPPGVGECPALIPAYGLAVIPVSSRTLLDDFAFPAHDPGLSLDRGVPKASP